jgi:hypothetical protein
MGIPIEGGFADVEEASFEPLPAGRYRVAIFSGEIRESKSEKHAGSQYVAWTLNVLDDEYKNRKLWLNTSLVPEARGLLKSFLKGVGYSDDELNASDFEFDIEEIVGREAVARVTKGINPNTKEENNSVRQLLPVGVGSEEDADLPV